LRPLSILDLRDTHEIGGPGKTILESYRAIDHAKFSLHLGLFRANDEREDTPFLAAAKAMGMPIHEIRASGPYDPRLIWRLATLVREQQFDLVHAHEVSSNVVTCLMSALHHVPIVSTAHGWIGNSRKQRLMIDLDKRVLRRFDRVIAVSGKMQRDLIDTGVPSSRVTLLHNGIVLEKYCRTNEVGALEALVGKRPPHPVLVSIGRLSPEKGHADLVDALALVAARGRHVSAVLAGDGPSRNDLVAGIRAAGLQEWVHLPGYISQPVRLLQEADLVVLPSHTEGLPNAALEALAMEVPVLATNVGGTPEVVLDGVTGKLVPAHSPTSLADAILNFLDDPATWRQWALQGRQRVEAQFDFKARTRKLEAIYVELIERESARTGKLEHSTADLR
jgi:glycosyltransferase involved in cell wall biosynthesis